MNGENEQKRQTLYELILQRREQGVDPSEDGPWFLEYEEKRARRDFIPRVGKFELTPACNLNCRMCYVHLEKYDPNQLLPTEQWISFIKEAHKMGMRGATLTGGECLTYPGFDEVYLALYLQGIWISILSNGVLMNKERVAFLKRYPPKKIQITIYGSNDDAYEIVTGKRAFTQVKENIERLQDAGLTVITTITPNRFMRDDPQTLMRTAKELGSQTRINFATLTPRKGTGREKTEASEEMIMQFYLAEKEYMKEQITPPEPCDVPDPNRESNGDAPEGALCGAGRSSFAILHDGRMSPCMAVDFITTEPMKHGFRAAWRELNEKMRHYPRPAECDACAYRKVCPQCLAIHQEAPRGHCDTRICERIHRMALEGLI